MNHEMQFAEGLVVEYCVKFNLIYCGKVKHDCVSKASQIFIFHL